MPPNRFGGPVEPLVPSADCTSSLGKPEHQRATSSCSYNTGSASSEDTSSRTPRKDNLSTIDQLPPTSNNSINNNNMASEAGVESVSTGSGRRKQSTRKKSRRSHSDIPNTVETGSYYGTRSHTPPRQQGGYYYGMPQMQTPTTGSPINVPYNNMFYPTQQQYNPPSGRSVSPKGPPPLSGGRDRSWSIDEGTPLIVQSERPSRYKSRHHRRAKSGSAAVPGTMGDFFAPEQPQKFSPRAELRKLTHGLGRHHRRTHSGDSAGSLYSYQKDNNNNLPPPPPPGYDPRQVIAPYSPQVSMNSSMMGGGEEAMTMSHPLSGGSRVSVRSSSMRKTHLRQQSVQVFMETIKGVEQRTTCRSVLFLLLFLFHLVFIGYLGMLYGEEAVTPHQDETEVTIIYNNFVLLACAGGLFAMVLSILLLANMMYFARNFIQVALVLVIGMSFVWGTLGIGLSPRNIVPVTGIIALALAIAYTFIVWDRIPFAAANLLTALSGIRDFPSTIWITFSFQLLLLGWSIYYSLVVCGIYDALKEHKWDVSERVEIAVYVLLAWSLYWTLQVMQGSIQAITGGVIYGWWHNPYDGAIVRHVTFKTLFYSLGSICFGSLFVGPVRILRFFSVLFRPGSQESSSLMSFHECLHHIKSCLFPTIESITSSFSPWAYTYVGMFHYGFLEAGAKSSELWAMRGWTTIVSDDLVINVFFLTSLVIGGVTGCFTFFLSQAESLRVTPGDASPGLITFVEGAVIGLILPSLIFSVIVGAMNAVLVCFATSPVDLEMNHPNLSHEMRHAWKEVWPEALDTCDIQLKHALQTPFVDAGSVRSTRSGSFDEYPLV